MELFKLLGTIVLEGADKVKSELSNVGSLFEKAGQGIQAVGDKIESTGKKLTPLSTAVAGVGTVAVKSFADFEAKMSNVQAISGATGDDLERLTAKAKEMGETTKFSASESADAFSYMAMAGWKTEDMLNGIEGIMNLAAASGEDLATTSDIVTDALTAFGLTASDAGHFADVLAATSSNANTNVSLMGETFKYIAPVAGSMGYTIEDMSLAIGLMANSGIKASQSGTALRNILTNLARPTDTVADAMDKLGITLDDGNGNMKSFEEVMLDLRAGFGDLKISEEELIEQAAKLDEQLESGEITQGAYDKAMDDLMESAYGAEGALKASAAAALAGKYGMSGLLAIVNSSDEDFAKLKEAINGATDAETGYSAAADMAQIMMDNFNGKLTILKSQLEGAAIKFGELIVPYLEPFVAKISEAVTWLTSLDPATQDMIIKIGLLVAALAPALIIGGKIVGVIGSVISIGGKLIGGIQTVFTVGKTLLTFILGFNPVILAIIAVIGSLIAIGVILYKHWDDIKAGIEDLKNSFVEGFNEIKTNVSKKWEEIKKNSSEKWEEIKKTIADSKLGQIASKVMTALHDTVSEKLKKIKKAYEDNGGGIKGIISATITYVKEYFTAGLTFIDKLTDGKLTEIKNRFTEKFDTIKKKVSDTIDSVKQKFDNLKLKLPDIKLPHFKLVGEFSLKPPSVPSLSVDWYKKAMNDPMIMNQPTAFGINGLGQIMAGGEAGSEVVSGTNTLMDMISAAVASQNSRIEDIIADLLELLMKYLPLMANSQIVLDSGAVVGQLAPYMDAELGKLAVRNGRGV